MQLNLLLFTPYDKMAPIPQIPLLEHSGLSLDISGVAGFFGGDVAVKAMSTVHVYPGRKYLGWYNTPGTYEIARQYGQLARSRFWDGLYPGPNLEPAELFELDGEKGPSYRDIQSGTVMRKTGHLAHIFSEGCKALPALEKFTDDGKGYRKTSPVNVTIVDLGSEPPSTMKPSIMDTACVRAVRSLIAHIPILASLATCIACGLYEDWICFAMILTGILCNGISCFLIGTGVLTFTHPKPADGSPPALGILNDGEQLIILRGPEGSVNSITRGRFALEYNCHEHYHRIGVCALLLTTQFLAQLLLLPQGKVFGQIMFLSSLAVSWGYNSYLTSIDREQIQYDILTRSVLPKPRMLKYTLGTRTAMAVFVLNVLAAPRPEPYPTPEDAQVDLQEVLNDLLPNNTQIWKSWKKEVLAKIDLYRHGATREEVGLAARQPEPSIETFRFLTPVPVRTILGCATTPAPRLDSHAHRAAPYPTTPVPLIDRAACCCPGMDVRTVSISAADRPSTLP